jgi:hypothetical protein
MATVELVDTSIMVNILDVPKMNDDRATVTRDLRAKRSSGVRLVLPVTTVIETGNHVAQIADGGRRWECANRFVEHLRLLLQHRAPWVLHELGWNADFLDTLISGAATGTSLVDHAVNRVGCGDLSILAERERYRATVSPKVSVGIWTLDAGLAAWS